ncbi:MAG: cupredoxin domain-containing protein [Planctomycetaceae bacterium]
MMRPVGPALGLAALALAATGCVSSAKAEPRAVIVNINHSRFAPQEFNFEAGTSVRFVIHNGDPIDHEFILGDDSVQNRHESGTHARHGVVPGEVSIPAGRTRSTTFTFDRSGTLTIGCHLPAHYAYGMRADVEITG